MRVGDETCYGSENGEGFDFEVGCGEDYLVFIEGYVGVVFFVYVDVFD